MQALLALIPLVLVCLALALKRSPITAALLGIASIVVLAIFVFPYNHEMVMVTIEALWLPVIEIALIVLGGILISEVTEKVGAQKIITQRLVSATGTAERATLLMSLGLVPFLESSIGYGLGIIITVPLLRSIGHSPTKAVALSLFGLTVTPWGSLGPGLIITAELGGITMTELGMIPSLLSGVVLFVLNLVVLFIAVPKALFKKYVFEVLIVTLMIWVALIVTNFWISVPLGGIFAALVGIITIIISARIRGVNQRSLLDRKLAVSASPYLVIIFGVILASVIAPLFENALVTRIATSPATWLILSGLISSVILGISRPAMGALIANSGRRWLRPGTIILLYLLFGALLNASGISTALAEGAAQFGLWNLLLVPAVNITAGYVTASVSAGAAMFSLSAAEIGAQLGISSASMLGLQTISNATATIVAPSRFALAAAALSAGTKPGAKQSEIETVNLETGPIQVQPHASDVEQVQVSKIILAGFGIVAVQLPFWIGITLLVG